MGTLNKKWQRVFIIRDISKNSEVLNKYDQVFSGIKHHIKKIHEEDGNMAVRKLNSTLMIIVL